MIKFSNLKTKTIFTAFSIFILIALLFYSFAPNLILENAERYIKKGETQKALNNYERVIRLFPNHRETPKALAGAAEKYNSQNLLFLSPTSIGGGGITYLGFGSNITEKSNEYYEILAANFPETFQGREAKRKLVIQNFKDLLREDDINKGINIIEDYYEDEKGHINFSVAESAAKHLWIYDHKEEAIEFLHSFLNKYSNISFQNIDELLGSFYESKNNKEKAIFHYEKVLKSINESIKREREMEAEHEDFKGPSEYIFDKRENIINRIESITDKEGPYGQIKGKITLHNNPLEGVYLYTIKKKDPNISSFPPMENDVWSISDEKGRFYFDNLKPGNYDLGMILDLNNVGDVVLKGGRFPKSNIEIEGNSIKEWHFDLVETMEIISPMENEVIQGNEVTYKWKPMEGAAYYRLEIGKYIGNGKMYTDYDKKIKNTNITLTTDQLALKQSGTSFDKEGPTPESFFSFYRPGGNYFWGVKAFDENDNMLSASIGYLHLQNSDYSFEEGELRKGDKYLLNREYGKAIEAYEDNLEENPKDVYALDKLLQLHRVGVHGSSNLDYEYTNEEKVKKYAEMLYEITEDEYYKFYK